MVDLVMEDMMYHFVSEMLPLSVKRCSTQQSRFFLQLYVLMMHKTANLHKCLASYSFSQYSVLDLVWNYGKASNLSRLGLG